METSEELLKRLILGSIREDFPEKEQKAPVCRARGGFEHTERGREERAHRKTTRWTSGEANPTLCLCVEFQQGLERFVKGELQRELHSVLVP